MKKQLHLLRALGLIFSIFLFNQAIAANGHLTGTVKTFPAPGAAIAGANVTALSAGWQTVSGTTNALGEFDIVCAPETYSQVTITKAGYHTIVVPGSYLVTDGGSTPLAATQYMKATHYTAFTGGDGGQPIWEQFISLATIDGVNLEADDEIAIYDGGTCVGLLSLLEAIPVAGPTTNFYQAKYRLAAYSYLVNPSAAGYTAGHTPTYKVWDYSAGLEYTNCIAYQNPEQPSTYSGSVFPTGWGAYGKTELNFLTAAPDVITGQITDNVTHNPISGATVTWGTYSATTDATGHYTLTVLSGSHNLVVSKVHYTTNTTLAQSSVGNPTVNVALVPISTHFSCTPGDPSKTWSIYLSSATLNGLNLTTDDEIAVYDGATCVGSYLIDDVLTAGTTTQHEMVAYRADGATPGFTGGHAYIFKCYDRSASLEIALTAGDPGITLGADGGNAYVDVVFPANDDEYSLVSLAFAVAPGSVSGSVTDNGAPAVNLAGVLVEAMQGAIVVASAHTGIAGTYSIPGLVAGTYDIVVTLSGYTFAASPASVVVTSGGTLTQNFVGVPVTGHQEIVLEPGFQFVSTYMNPTNPHLIGDAAAPKSMLDEIHNGFPILANHALLESIKDEGGNKFFWNGVDYTDNITSWTYAEGYVFNMLAGATLSVDGTRVLPSTPIDLTTGPFPTYRLISYYPQGEIDASVALDGIKSKLIWAKASNGKTLRKISGTWVNNIGYMRPGEGYQLYLSAAATLTYPTGVKSGSSTKGEDALKHFSFGGGNAANAVYTVFVNASNMNVGDEIAAYDNGVMVGAAKINSTTDPYLNNIPTFIQLGSGDGYHVGNPIVLRYWDSTNDKEYGLTINPVVNSGSNMYYYGTIYPGGDGKFTQFTVIKNAAGINDASGIVANIYPNPAHDYLKVVADRTIDKISLMNLVGQQVAEQPVNATTTQFNLSGIKAGVYFLRIECNGQSSTQKVVIQ